MSPRLLFTSTLVLKQAQCDKYWDRKFSYNFLHTFSYPSFYDGGKFYIFYDVLNQAPVTSARVFFFTFHSKLEIISIFDNKSLIPLNILSCTPKKIIAFRFVVVIVCWREKDTRARNGERMREKNLRIYHFAFYFALARAGSHFPSHPVSRQDLEQNHKSSLPFSIFSS